MSFISIGLNEAEFYFILLILYSAFNETVVNINARGLTPEWFYMMSMMCPFEKGLHTIWFIKYL